MTAVYIVALFWFIVTMLFVYGLKRAKEKPAGASCERQPVLPD